MKSILWIRSLKTVIRYHPLAIKHFCWRLSLSVFTAKSLNFTPSALEDFVFPSLKECTWTNT